eukprot:m.46951 g.46951  ORF g.46951 m.46951 type:complete len:173 (+) comp17579_c0_seq2:529-1047(+)
MRREMHHVRNCSDVTNSVSSSPNHMWPDGLPSRFRWGTRGCWPRGSSSDIKRDYIPRGIYIEQIRHFLKYFPRDQLLVLSSAALREDPNKTMNMVFNFLGLRPHDVSGLSQEDLEEMLNRKWPKFESATGWLLHSTYDPLPPKLKQDMQAFYQPFNKLLFDFLGEDFGWNNA